MEENMPKSKYSELLEIISLLKDKVFLLEQEYSTIRSISSRVEQLEANLHDYGDIDPDDLI